jgi:hypothetical protein
VGIPNPQVMKRILDVTVEVQYPPYLSDEAVDCMSRLLDRRPAHRLGSGANGIEDIMRHPWFARVDWTKLEARRVKPPRFEPSVAALTSLRAGLDGTIMWSARGFACLFPE